MIYGIASYHRPECRTVRTLLDAGVDKRDILIATQTEDDYEDYRRLHEDIRVIYREASSAAGNRNTILETVKERPLILLDDDITSIAKYDGKSFKPATEECLRLIEKIVEESEGICIGGVAASSNGLFAKGRWEYDADTLLQGSLLFVYDREIRFSEKYLMVEDYEICLRAIAQGKHTSRYNHICAMKPKNGSNKGGLHERYENGEDHAWHKRLAKEYPMYKPNKNLTGGHIRWK